MIITEARIGYYERLKDELDEIVHELAKKYCEIFGINFAYGVDVWYIEWKSVNVRLDQTCRGCYSSEGIVLDRSWLTMPFENARRSPRLCSCRGRKPSRARIEPSTGKPLNAVFAARTRMRPVTAETT